MPQRTFVAWPIQESIVVAFEAGSPQLSSEELRRLRAFLDGVDPRHAMMVLLEGGGAKGEERRRAISAELLASGVREDTIVAPEVSSPSGSVRVTIRAQGFLSVDCENEAEHGSYEWGLGCANELNLLHMVESRRDLLHGRRPGPGSAERGLRAMERFRQQGDGGAP